MAQFTFTPPAPQLSGSQHCPQETPTMSCVASSTNLDQPAADPCPLLSINSSLKSQRPPSLPSSLLQPPLPPPPPPPPPLDERCSICMEDEDGNPTVRLSCKHVFHKQCLDAQVAAKSPSPRLTFGYLCCALCRAPMSRDVEIDKGRLDSFASSILLYPRGGCAA